MGPVGLQVVLALAVVAVCARAARCQGARASGAAAEGVTADPGGVRPGRAQLFTGAGAVAGRDCGARAKPPGAGAVLDGGPARANAAVIPRRAEAGGVGG